MRRDRSQNRSQCVALSKTYKNDFGVRLLKTESCLVSHIDQEMAAEPFSNGEFCFGPPCFDQLLNISSKLVGGQIPKAIKVARKRNYTTTKMIL
jgi:hypothetical protein